MATFYFNNTGKEKVEMLNLNKVRATPVYLTCWGFALHASFPFLFVFVCI